MSSSNVPVLKILRSSAPLLAMMALTAVFPVISSFTSNEVARRSRLTEAALAIAAMDKRLAEKYILVIPGRFGQETDEKML